MARPPSALDVSALHPGPCPRTGERGPTLYCKGFGAVNSYFVRSSAEAPPKDLLLELGLEPRYGLYYFDNVLVKAQQPVEHIEGKSQVL